MSENFGGRSSLRAHPLVDDAALATLDQEGEPRVCAVIVPSEAGWRLLERDGRRGFGRALAEHFAADWEPVLRPRQWRAVRALPRNAMGKVTREALLALFERAVWGEPVDEFPELLSETRDGDTLERLCHVPAGLSDPSDPTGVPAERVLGWVLSSSAALLGGEARLQKEPEIQLRAPLRPGDCFTLRVERVAANALHFSISCGGRELAAGRLRAEPA